MRNLTINELNSIYPLGENRTGKPIFITFKADWWGPCKQFGQVLDSVLPAYEGKVEMFTVNIDAEPTLSNQFGVRSIPYTVMISTSGERMSQLGSITVDQLKYMLDGLLLKK